VSQYLAAVEAAQARWFPPNKGILFSQIGHGTGIMIHATGATLGFLQHTGRPATRHVPIPPIPQGQRLPQELLDVAGEANRPTRRTIKQPLSPLLAEVAGAIEQTAAQAGLLMTKAWKRR
jgi:hypothetical protein